MIFDRDLRQLRETARTQEYRPRTDDPAAPGEAFAAAFDLLVSEEQSVSGWRWRRPYVDARQERVAQLTGRNDDLLLSAYYGADETMRKRIQGFIDSGEITVGPIDPERPREIPPTDMTGTAVDWMDDSLMPIQYHSDQARQMGARYRDLVRALLTIQALKQLDPEILTDEEIDERVKARAAIIRESSHEVLGRVEGAAGTSAQFAGAALGAVTDPLIMASLPAGAGPIRGGSVMWNAAKAFSIEAGIALAAEVPVQAMVYNFKQEIDSPWGIGPAAFNVLAAAVGAGTIRASASSAIDLGLMARHGAPLRLVEAERIITEHLNAPLNAEGASRMIRRYQAEVAAGRVRASPEHDKALRELAAWRDTAVENKLGPERLELHFERVEQAMDDIASHRPASPTTEPPAIQGGREVSRSGIIDVDPDEILVDAARFQFKAGGDEFGVTDRLQGVRRFDRYLAGVVTVWEDLSGRRFIVDGHQRVGLARRARAAGQAREETMLSAFVVREADGVSAVQARQSAAIKNIAEGTGSPLDAAKVIRDMGAGADPVVMFNLPPNSALVRHARGLAKLEDEPFMAVVNELVPQEYAAIVGERILGAREQAAVLQLLARTEPANQNQARMIVEQARAAGFETRTTEDLFGAQEIAESFYLERAKVLDAAMRKLRQDRQAFRTVVSRETTLEEAGNVLNQQANAARLASDEEILGALAVSANARGPISDALNAAARRVRDGARPASVADDFLETVRAQGLRGGTPGAATGRVGPDAQIDKMMRQGYDGLTGEELSRALARDGYDGIVTVETLRGQAVTSEIVDLTSFRAADLDAPPGRVTQEAPAPQRAPEMDLFGEAPVREQALADAQRAVDERLGAGREAVPAESRGDLFDTGRARQTDIADPITDARVQAVARELGLDMPPLSKAEGEELARLLREEGQLLELPDRIEIDPDGRPIAVGRRMNEVFSELDNQGRALDAVQLCITGGRVG